MRYAALLITLTTPFAASCKRTQDGAEAADRSATDIVSHSSVTLPSAGSEPRVASATQGAAKREAVQFRDTVDTINEDRTAFDPSTGTETLHLDEPSFAQIVSAFAEAASEDPNEALAILGDQVGELYTAVVKAHFDHLVTNGGGGGSGSVRDFIGAIDDDDERRGAVWLLTRSLLQRGDRTEAEVAAALQGLDGISHTTAGRMVATTANLLAREAAAIQ